MYIPLEMLGKGTFATVFKVKRILDSEVFAAKYYFRDVYLESQSKEKYWTMITNELKILSSIKHEGVMKVYELY